MPIGFVLSGGASLGAIQAGMLQALFEQGVTPDLIVATSVGAVNGAFIASRPSTVATAETLGDVWRTIDRDEVFPPNLVTGLLGFIGRRSSLLPNTGLRRLVERHVEFERLEDASIPLHLIGVDVKTGRERRLSEGNVIEAVLASAAIPAIFPPVAWGDVELIDGGVANNTPISHAIELGATEIYVLPTGYACDLHATPRSALGMALHALTLLIQQRLVWEIRAFQDHVRLVVLPPPCPLDVTPADFSHADELIERARREARSFLAAASVAGSAVPPVMRGMHGHDPVGGDR
jgi:NTE family protein